MPIYEFICPHCNHKFEKICRVGGSELIHCPECGVVSRKVFSTFNFQFSMFLKELDKGTII